jgi:hypothetical protein
MRQATFFTGCMQYPEINFHLQRHIVTSDENNAKHLSLQKFKWHMFVQVIRKAITITISPQWLPGRLG